MDYNIQDILMYLKDIVMQVGYQMLKTQKSHNGYVFTLGGALVSWKSSKCTIIARSTIEFEFIALDKYGEEAK